MPSCSPFWYTIDTMQALHGYDYHAFELFGPVHLFWLGLCAFLCAGGSVLLLPGHGAVRVGFSAVPFVQHQPVRLRLVRPAPPPSGRRSALRPLPARRGGGPAFPLLAGPALVERHAPALQHRPHHAGGREASAPTSAACPRYAPSLAWTCWPPPWSTTCAAPISCSCAGPTATPPSA